MDTMFRRRFDAHWRGREGQGRGLWIGAFAVVAAVAWAAVLVSWGVSW